MRNPSEASIVAMGDPSETSRLLSAAGRETEASSNGSQRQSCGPKPIVSLLAVLVVIAGARWIYDDYVHNPVVAESRLTERYAIEANQAIELLNARSFASKKDIPVGCESTLLLIRHCEDLGGHVRYEDGSSHCSYLGFQRSMYLATLFGAPHQNASHAGRWPLPSKLYGLWNHDGTNKRQYEVLRPLSDKSGVKIQMFDFESAPEELRDNMFHLLSSGQFCNQVAVIAWKHKFIRPLAAELGCDQERGCPNQWDDYDFDTVWQLQYVYQPEELRAFPIEQSVATHNDKRLVEGWEVFGSVTHEDFDALEFKRDYYDGSTESKNWMNHGGH